MKFDYQQFIEYVDQHAANASLPGADTLLGLLTHYYLLLNPVTSETSAEIILTLEPVFKQLSRRKIRMVHRAIEQTASEYAAAAFEQGILVGAQLILELTGLSRNTTF